MTTFDDREKGFESKYALDQEQEFKAVARRNKLLGLWAAGKMGLNDAGAEEYGRAIVKADFEQPGEEDVYRKIAQDLEGAGLCCWGRWPPWLGTAVGPRGARPGIRQPEPGPGSPSSLRSC